MKKNIIIAVIGVAVIGLAFVLYRYGSSSPEEAPQQGAAVELQPATHIAEGAAHLPYNSNPPTSGPHYAQSASWGVYEQILPDELLVHNLEHGGIWISYKDIDAETLSKLKDVARRYPGAVVLAPRPSNDAKITLASWGYLEKMESYDESKIISFIGANKNKSPEKLAR